MVQVFRWTVRFTRRGSIRWKLWVALLGVGLCLVGLWAAVDFFRELPPDAQAKYVGSQSCARCHAAQAHHWEGSHHALAMQEASGASVLGDFGGGELTAYGVTSRMYRDQERFMVRTEGPDGKLHDYRVKYAFGVDPLQQYLVEFDRPSDATEGENGRLQVLPLSWDTRKGRWFHLTPSDVHERVLPGDELHWTGSGYNWNHMCAECHSTNLEKNFQVERRQYRTTFSEVSVGCEACHGPGSLHVQLAEQKTFFWDRKRGYALADLKRATAEQQIQTCAPCHSRRDVIATGFRGGDNYYDHYRLELLRKETYFADGQILDEDYEVGSFLQSKMYHKDIRCSDCHDPHTAKVKFNDNQLCTSCHAHKPEKYDHVNHHHHTPGTEAASCVACHMPGRFYMEVHFRRDHSLRVPRPDLSLEVGSPNACTGCHLKPEKLGDLPQGEHPKDYADWRLLAKRSEVVKKELTRLDRWSVEQIEKWRADKPPGERSPAPPHFAAALAAAWRHDPQDDEQIVRQIRNKETPAIVRASLLVEMAELGGREAPILNENLSDLSPLVRSAAAGSLSYLTPRDKVTTLLPLLRDPRRLVRLSAASSFFHGTPPEKGSLSAAERGARNDAAAEYIEFTRVAPDRGASYVLQGGLQHAVGEPEAALRAYREAVRIEPDSSAVRPPLYRFLQASAEDLVQNMQQLPPTSPQRIGLERQYWELRREIARLREEQQKLVEADVRRAPQVFAAQQAYGVLMAEMSEWSKAEAALRAAEKLEPNSLEPPRALCDLYMQKQDWTAAEECAKRLLQLRPNLPEFQFTLVAIQERLKKAAERPSPPSGAKLPESIPPKGEN